jgi:hypothetical protein
MGRLEHNELAAHAFWIRCLFWGFQLGMFDFESAHARSLRAVSRGYKNERGPSEEIQFSVNLATSTALAASKMRTGPFERRSPSSCLNLNHLNWWFAKIAIQFLFCFWKVSRVQRPQYSGPKMLSHHAVALPFSSVSWRPQLAYLVKAFSGAWQSK